MLAAEDDQVVRLPVCAVCQRRAVAAIEVAGGGVGVFWFLKRDRGACSATRDCEVKLSRVM
jgi:hypothetical protein